MLDGYGVGLFFCGLIKEDVESGLLRAPFDVTVDPGSAYYLLTPQRRPTGQKLELFRKWLMDEVATSPLA